ncbi:hypothetical protein ACTJJ6_02455 [Serratia sp. 22278]|uniref:hypothetical protein n=1 Tax=unclassified Serratia (in: enterobacteria) TaxID=2647522 RepID=UPI0038BE31E7
MTEILKSNPDVITEKNSLNCDAKKTEVTIDVDGIKKTIMRFELKSNGDVIMILKHAGFYREKETAEYHGQGIKQQRYSFHRSLKSPSKINVIKHTYEMKNGELIDTRVVTPVIKNKSGFVQVYSRRVPTLTPERYNTKPLSKVSVEENLGYWDVNNSTLLVSVFVGSASLNISHDDNIVNIRSFVRGDFRFVLTWTYLMMPAHSSGALRHRMTLKLDNGMVLGLANGLSINDVVLNAIHEFWYLSDEFAKTISAEQGFSLETIFEIIKLTGFVKDGRRCSLAYQERLRKMVSSGTYIRHQYLLGKLLNKI